MHIHHGISVQQCNDGCIQYAVVCCQNALNLRLRNVGEHFLELIDVTSTDSNGGDWHGLRVHGLEGCLCAV